jgi:uncharacterized cupredoxin-like copper-binding protein
MMTRRLFVAVAGVAAATQAMPAMPALAHGPGHPMSGGKMGDARKVTRVIDIVAADNAFSLKSLEVRDGETVRFVVRNDGLEHHELLIGTRSEHAEHLRMMRAMIEAQKKQSGQTAHAGHAAPMMDHSSGVAVAPGQTASFVWTFARTADLEFACDIPGHYEDGMRGPISFVR